VTSGDIVAQVAPGTPASSQLQPGDVIVSADGQGLDGKDALSKILAARKVGDTLKLQVQRGSQLLSVPITLAERPASFGASPPQTEP